MNILLQEELSKIIDREIEFTPGNLVTITKVDTSSDKQYAAVFISVLGAGIKESLEILQKNVYNIQKLLNRKIRTRPVPKIRFTLDEGEMKREKVEKSLVELKKNKEI